MACPTARYVNLGSQPIKLGIGSTPGKAWDRYDSAPGGVVVGPAAYTRTFAEAGYTLVTPEIQVMLDEDEAKANAAPEPAPIVEQAKPAEEAPPVQPELVWVKAEEPAPAVPVAADAARGRRRGRPQ